DAVAHPGDGAEGVRPRPQVGDGAQELVGVALLLERVGQRVGLADDGDGVGLDLRGLPLGGRGADLAGHAATGADGEAEDVTLVIRELAVGDDRDVAETGAVVELDEAEAALGVAPGAHPAPQPDAPADRLRLPRLRHADGVHACLLLAGPGPLRSAYDQPRAP